MAQMLTGLYLLLFASLFLSEIAANASGDREYKGNFPGGGYSLIWAI